jgi:hypothetical protein
MLAKTWSISGQLSTIELGFLRSSHGPVRPLACTARFEREKNLNNTLKVLKSGVAYTPRTLDRGGIRWLVSDFCRWELKTNIFSF